MNKAGLVAFILSLIIFSSATMLSTAQSSVEHSLKSEVTVGSYTNFTARTTEVNTNNGRIVSIAHYYQYENTTIESITGNSLKLTQKVGNLDNSTPGEQSFSQVVSFNSTTTDFFSYLNTSYSFLNQDNFTITRSDGTYAYNNATYPMVKIIAENGVITKGTGVKWWFSNQTLEYDPTSGIIFYQAVHTSVLTNRTSWFYLNGTFTLKSTSVDMSNATTAGSLPFYEEAGIAAAVIVVAGVAIFELAVKRRKN